MLNPKTLYIKRQVTPRTFLLIYLFFRFDMLELKNKNRDKPSLTYPYLIIRWVASL